MIRMILSRSANQAKEYFNDALLKSDYYLNSQELPGHFHGKLAQRLNIEGAAGKDIFHALCENIHPKTGKPLTPRTKANRTTGYDINFHVPKSVSVLHALSNDDHILKSFQDSVISTMQLIEADMKTRVRKNGKDEDQRTQELLYTSFIHQTSRPVEGLSADPHLHCHCFTFNATWDEQEQRIKAGQFRDIKGDMPYYQAWYHKDLSDRLAALGFGIRQTKNAFEIEGVPEGVIELFSKRTDEIGRVAKAENITDATKLSQIGARTRKRKQAGQTIAELKKDWRRQIKSAGLHEANAVIRGNGKNNRGVSAKRCIDYALQHCFERKSVIQDRRILAVALLNSIGATATANAIETQFLRDSRIIHHSDGNKAFCTTQEVLQEEKQIITLATNNLIPPICQSLPVLQLSGEHAQAARMVLTTDSAVSIIEGRAGTGKTTMMKETVSLIEQAGKECFIVAPTSHAVREVLHGEGFTNAETVAALLTNISLQEKLSGQVIWVDEAGLLGTKDMKALLELGNKHGAKLILSGDTRQHASVPRGDALRLLKDVAKAPCCSISTIYRQKSAQYRQAVQDLSNGNVQEGFDKLEKLHAIIEVDPYNPYAAIVEDYLKAIKKRKSALIISPKHKEGADITKALRQSLKQQGMLGTEETILNRMVNLNLTKAEKGNAASYKPGQVIQLQKASTGIKRGSRWTVEAACDDWLIVHDNMGAKHHVSLQESDSFEVYETQALAIAKGDIIRITQNGLDCDKKRLSNGQSLQVHKIGKQHVTLINLASKVKYQIPKDYGHLNHAYCMTSHASQGKTVDEVFIAHPTESFSATDMKQFYVSVSRGREKVSIYTDDKVGLLLQASRSNERLSAVELLMKSSKPGVFANQQGRVNEHFKNNFAPN